MRRFPSRIFYTDQKKQVQEVKMSETLRFVSDDLQLMALSFMAIVYIIRIRWLLKFKASRDRQAPSGA